MRSNHHLFLTRYLFVVIILNCVGLVYNRHIPENERGLVVATDVMEMESTTIYQRTSNPAMNWLSDPPLPDDDLSIFMGRDSSSHSSIDSAAQNSEWYCDPQLGCLTHTPAWHDATHRPVYSKPWPRDQIMTKFSLHTREARNTGVYLAANDTKTITDSSFKASRLTKIVIHGNLNTGYEDIFQDMITNLLVNGDYNVIMTHWGPGASGTQILDFLYVVANSRVVGLEIAYLVNTLLEDFDVHAEDVHLIGHSIGAHVAGYAGERIANLGRITGLDPAGPLFANMDPIVRLDPSDALFVDVLHTNAGVVQGTSITGFGILQPSGHVDIYANNGNFQPGCPYVEPSISLLELSLETSDPYALGCSHARAREIFRDSLISSCQAVAYECSDYDTFKQGNCYSCGDDNSRCFPVLGMHHINHFPVENRTNVKLFYSTSESSPFCQYQYAIRLKLADTNSQGTETFDGILSLSVQSNGDISEVSNNVIDAVAQKAFRLTNDEVNFRKGEEYSFLVTSLENLGEIKSFTLSWVPSATVDCSPTDCDLYVANISMSALNNYPEAERLANTYVGCAATGRNYIAIGLNSSAKYTAIKGPSSCI